MHVFQFSPRKGTPAAEHKNQVDGNIKHERSKKLIDLTNRLTAEFNRGFINTDIEVLFEETSKVKEGYMEGYTTNYVRVAVESKEDIEGKIENVKIKSDFEEILIGEIIKK